MVSFQRPSWSPASWTNPSKPFLSVCPESYEIPQHRPASESRASQDTSNLPTFQALDLSQLSPFETVNNQFLAMGIQVEGAIALQPSNPIFWTRQQSVVLMPIAGRQSIEFVFQQPTQHLCVSVLGVREVRLIATTRDRQHRVQRSANPNRPLRHPNDLLEPLAPSVLEIEGEALTSARLESSHPFVVATIMYRLDPVGEQR